MKFHTIPYADLSTADIAPPDADERTLNQQLDLLDTGPYTFAAYTVGCFMWVPTDETVGEMAERLLGHGFLPRMVDIFTEAQRQGIQYLRFDSDGLGIGEDNEETAENSVGGSC